MQRSLIRSLLVLMTAVAARPADAQPLASAVAPVPSAVSAQPAGRDWFGVRPWSEWGTVTGDWNAGRTWLTDRGLVVAVSETIDVSGIRMVDGNGRSAGRGLFDAVVTMDGAILHIPGGSAAAELQWFAGTNAAGLASELQGFSNIDASDLPLVGELWYQQQIGPRVRIKAGRTDANAEFAYVDAASDFLSPSMGFSPSIVLPTYPTPASSVTLFVKPLAGIELGGGVFNGSPEDGRWLSWTSRFSIAQVHGQWTLGGTGLTGAILAGGWERRDLDGATDRMSGVYLTAEQAIWSAAERSATIFVQVGASNAGSPVERHTGGGLTVRGAMLRRPLDVTGVGATWARTAIADGHEPELVVEAFHRVVLTPSVSVIPDLQIIDGGSGGARRRSAAMTCRLQFDF